MPHKRFNQLQDKFFDVLKQMHEAEGVQERTALLNELQSILKKSKAALEGIHGKQRNKIMSKPRKVKPVRSFGAEVKTIDELVIEFQMVLDLGGSTVGGLERLGLISAASETLLEAIELAEKDQRGVAEMAERLRAFANPKKILTLD